jgi:DNA polymerase-3 subunit delta'
MTGMILGHERQLTYLQKVIERGRLAHAYLFYGPERVGKFTAAKWLVKKLQCEKGGCGDCSDCRLIENNSYPYVTLLDIEHTLTSEKEERKEIPIDDIRELKRIFSLTPLQGRWRIAVINQAEKLNYHAANAFLKLLEEPGSRTLFILITADKESVLPTIASRSIPIRFSPLPDNAIREFLKTRLSETALLEDIVKFSAGRPGVAVGLAEDREAFLRERHLASEIGSMLKGGAPQALRLSQRISENRVLRQKAVEYLIRALLRALRESEAEKRGIWTESIKRVNYIADLLESANLNPRLALDVMFLAARQK